MKYSELIFLILGLILFSCDDTPNESQDEDIFPEIDILDLNGNILCIFLLKLLEQMVENIL